MENVKINTCSYCKELIEYTVGLKPTVCPFCQHKYSMKPPIEFKLLSLQDEYLKDKNNKEISNIFFKNLHEYIYKLLLKKLKGKLSLNASIIQDKVNYTVAKLFIYFQKPSFRIEGSFGGYINLMLLGTLYNRKRRREEDHISLDKKMDDEKHEIIDKLFDIGFSTISEQVHDVEYLVLNDNTRIIEKLIIIIDEMFELIKTNDCFSNAVLFKIGLFHSLNRTNELYLDKFFYHFGSDINRYVNNTSGILYEVLKNSLMD